MKVEYIIVSVLLIFNKVPRMSGMETVNGEQRREEVLRIRHSLLHTPVLEEASGQLLGEPRAPLRPSAQGSDDEQSGENKSEGNQGIQRGTSGRGMSEEHLGDMRQHPQLFSVRVLVHNETLAGSNNRKSQHKSRELQQKASTLSQGTSTEDSGSDKEGSDGGENEEEYDETCETDGLQFTLEALDMLDHSDQGETSVGTTRVGEEHSETDYIVCPPMCGSESEDLEDNFNASVKRLVSSNL